MKLRQWMQIDLGALFRGRGLVIAEPVAMAPGPRKSFWQRLFSGGFRRKNNARDLIQVTDQLHQLVTCQAPLAEGLKHAATDCPSAPVSRQLYRLAQALDQGGTLAEGLGKVPTFCPRYYTDLVGAAEVSGHLNETLLELSHDLEQNLKANHALRSRTVYVLVLLMSILAISTFLHVKVFTVLDDIWGEFGGMVGRDGGLWKALVDYTGVLQARVSFLIGVGAEWFKHVLGWNGRGSNYWDGLIPTSVFAGLALLATVVVLSLLLRRPARFVFDRLPVIRGALFHARWGHALKIISMLLERGIPLDRALESAAGSDLDRSTRKVLLRMSDGTRAGLSFPEVLEKEKRRVPRSLKSAVAFGDHVGRLPELLSRLSHMYRLGAERTLRVVSDIAFPMAIIGCGVLIASVNTRFFILMTNIVDGIMGNM